jgi:hypothetical protein
MSESKLIECKYGKHLAEKSNFTESGLNNIYKICKSCNCEKTKKYRQLNREKSNESRREYNRIWITNKRATEKMKTEIESN